MTAKAWNLICFESHGIPISLYGENSARRAIATGSLTPQMSVVVYEDDKGVRIPAAQVPQLRPLFPPGTVLDPPAPTPAPTAPADERTTRDRAPAEVPRERPEPSPGVSESASVLLPRGGNINLSRASPGLSRVIVGLGWDTAAASSGALDLDTVIFLQTARGKVRNDADVVFYNNPTGADGAVQLCLPPSPQRFGDLQSVTIALDALGPEISKVTFALAIYEGLKRGQNFGMVEGAYIRVVNADDLSELARCNISRDVRTETAVVLGEIYDLRGDWKFKAVDQGFSGGLSALGKSFDVDIENA